MTTPARALLPLGLLLGGCMGRSLTNREVYTRDIEQVGVVPAPSGLHAVGPLAPEGGVAVDASLSSALVASPRQSREQGAPGAFVASDWGRLRLSHGVRRGLEIGLELEGSPLELVHPLATDLGDATVTGLVGRAGPWVRARAQGRGGGYLESQIQGYGTLLPYNHIETLHITATSWEHGLQTSESTRTVWDQRESVLFFWGWRGGFAFGRVNERGWDLSLGLGGEILPSFYGYQHDQWSCSWFSDGSAACETEPKHRDTKPVLSWSGAATLGVPLGDTPFTLIGTLTAMSGDAYNAPELMLVPLGGSLGMRWSSRPSDQPAK